MEKRGRPWRINRSTHLNSQDLRLPGSPIWTPALAVLQIALQSAHKRARARAGAHGGVSRKLGACCVNDFTWEERVVCSGVLSSRTRMNRGKRNEIPFKGSTYHHANTRNAVSVSLICVSCLRMPPLPCLDHKNKAGK